MTEPDFLFTVSATSEDAESNIRGFVERTKTELGKLPKVSISVDLKGLDDAARKIDDTNSSQARARSEADAAERRILDLQNQISRMRVQGVQMEAAELQRVLDLENKISNVVNGQGSVASGKRALREATGVRTVGAIDQRNTEADAKKAAAAQREAASAFDVGTGAIGRQRDALDLLNRILGNTVFKFIEYELIMRAFNGTMSEIGNSLKEAGDVQFEQTLQSLYQIGHAQISLNQSLQNAVIIARQWGSDITDVQQAIGMWTKQTNDLAAATYLANQAEMMHRASGIETMEVYKDSVAMATQLGITLDKLPTVYDQVAEAALRMAVPMKSINGGGVEAMKDLFQGVAASAATLKSMGFTDKGDAAAGSIAIVANQIQSTGDAAKSASKNLTSMFAALEGAGNHRAAFESIIGKPEDIKSFDDLMARMQKHLKELYQAYSDGKLGVRPSQFESLQTFESSLSKIRDIYNDIKKNSNGKLQLIADTEMETYNALLDRVRTSVQQFSLALGQQLIPTATNAAHLISGTFLPALTYLAPLLVKAAGAGMLLGGAMLFLMAQSKVGAMLQGVAMQSASAAAMADAYGAAELKSAGAMAAAIQQMEAEKAVIAELQAQKEALAWITGDLAAKEAELGVAIGTVSDIAGTRAVSGFAAMGAAVKGAVGTLTSALGPMVAILAVMGMINGLSKGQNAGKFVELGLKGNGGSDLGLIGTGVSAAPQFIGAAVSGHANDLMVGPAALDNMRREKTPEGQRARDLLANLQKAQRSGDKARVDDLAGMLGSLVQQHVERNVDGYDQVSGINDAIKKVLAGIKLGEGAQEAPGANKTGKKGHSPDDEDKFRHGLEAEKRDDQALISLHNDLATSYRDQVEAVKTLADEYGWSQKSVTDLNVAYQKQIEQTFESAGAAQDEANVLGGRIAQARKMVATTKEGTDAHEKAKTNLSMLVAAYEKATGAAEKYRAEVVKLNAERLRDVAAGDISAYLASATPRSSSGMAYIDHPTDLEGYRKAGESAVRTASNASGGLTGQIAASESGLSQLHAYVATLTLELNKLKAQGASGKALDPLKAAITSLNGALGTLGKNVTTAESKLTEIAHTIADMQDTILRSNTKDIGELLGIDPAELDYVTAVADGYKKVADERDRLAKLQKEIGDMADSDDPKNQARAKLLQQQIIDTKALTDEYESLIPQIARMNEVRASDEYKATSSVLNSTLSKSMDAAIDNVFASGGKGRNASGLKAAIADWTKQVMGAYLKQMVTSLTDSIFHLDPNAKQNSALTKIYNDHVTGILNGAHAMQAAADMMKAAADENLTAAGGTPTGGGHLASGRTPQQAPKGFDGMPYPGAPAGSGNVNPQDDPNGTATSKDQSVNADSADKMHADDNNDNLNKQTSHLSSIDGTMSDMVSTVMVLLGMLGGGQTPGALGGAGSLMTMLGTMASKNGIGSGMFGGVGLGGALTGLGATLGIGTMMGGLIGGKGNAAAGTDGGIGALLGVGGAIGAASLVTGASFFGAMAGLMSGPVGIGLLLGSALLGGSIGGLLGPNWGPSSNYPDRSNTAAYGQFVSNVNGGVGTFNGQQIGPTSQYDTSLGHENLAEQMYDYVSNASNYPGVTGASLAAIQQLLGLSGGTEDGLGITNEHNGMFTLASGQTVSVADYQNLISQVQQIQENTKNTANALAPLMSINAYGAGNDYAPDAYNIPGMNASELAALQQNKFSTYLPPMGQQTPDSAYSTPGVGNNQRSLADAIAASLTNGGQNSLLSQSVIQIVSNLLVDSNVLASAVNSVNLAQAQRYGQVSG